VKKFFAVTVPLMATVEFSMMLALVSMSKTLMMTSEKSVFNMNKMVTGQNKEKDIIEHLC
jgi:hypothetical protein